MTDFFDDPDLRAQLARFGVVHKPGLADQTLRELAPLLAADGIDLDDLDGIDIDTLNAALARATERHNEALFTPAGAHQAQALAVLRAVGAAIADGDDEAARTALAQIRPDAGAGTPSIAHLIGVSLSLLDAWHTDPEQRAALASTRIPRWDKSSRAAATDILALARKGRAFDALDSLHRRHTGLAIFHGGALVVAASLISRAKHESRSVPALAERVLAEDSTDVARALREPPPAEAKAPRKPGRPSSLQRVARGPGLADRSTAREFRRWVGRRFPDPAIVSGEAEMLEQLFTAARAVGLDPHDPTDIDELIELILAIEDSQEVESALDTLHDYIHFRIDTADSIEGWEDAHQLIEAVLEDSPEADALSHAMDSARQLPLEERREALAGTRVVSAVSELLAWVGTGRPATASGAVRRADIEHVAGLLGVSAVGVSRRPRPQPGIPQLFALDDAAPEPGTVFALSMQDVPMLPAWWQALVLAGVIETTASRVRPGETAAAWLEGPLPPHDLAEMVAGLFTAELLTQDLESGLVPFERAAVSAVIGRLLHALAPELIEDDGDLEQGALERFLGPRVLRMLREFERAGLLRSEDEEPAVVPIGLRMAVARGVILTMAHLAAGSEDEFEDEDD